MDMVQVGAFGCWKLVDTATGVALVEPKSGRMLAQGSDLPSALAEAFRRLAHATANILVPKGGTNAGAWALIRALQQR